jgi:hypothetical protein
LQSTFAAHKAKRNNQNQLLKHNLRNLKEWQTHKNINGENKAKTCGNPYKQEYHTSGHIDLLGDDSWVTVKKQNLYNVPCSNKHFPEFVPSTHRPASK